MSDSWLLTHLTFQKNVMEFSPPLPSEMHLYLHVLLKGTVPFVALHVPYVIL